MPVGTDADGLPLVTGEYPLIDADPHFFRVVRFFRLSDLVTMSAFIAGAPVITGLMDYHNYFQLTTSFSENLTALKHCVRQSRSVLGPWPSIALGTIGGFLYAYQRSCARFFGLSENEAEVKKDMREMRNRARLGLPLYGESSLTPELQLTAAKYTRYSPLKLSVVPLVNIVNHPYHGIDTSKYYS
ncbi:C-terminal of NADH-ubiquinone oxidoreductase 21 kDa subunit-domain-containing protein [Limtongia smithiae]|uniref:C-terminal of NADH-ubiquinone oxidoreductase 21 kDa subunit-domain-containing protein n=1 Tax=Limtongia smithiae TaxID=1125753 RepID=UPI0034CE30F6